MTDSPSAKLTDCLASRVAPAVDGDAIDDVPHAIAAYAQCTPGSAGELVGEPAGEAAREGVGVENWGACRDSPRRRRQGGAQSGGAATMPTEGSGHHAGSGLSIEVPSAGGLEGSRGSSPRAARDSSALSPLLPFSAIVQRERERVWEPYIRAAGGLMRAGFEAPPRAHEAARWGGGEANREAARREQQLLSPKALLAQVGRRAMRAECNAG